MTMTKYPTKRLPKARSIKEMAIGMGASFFDQNMDEIKKVIIEANDAIASVFSNGLLPRGGK